MALLSAFVRARPARIAHASNTPQYQHVEAGGSWLACILAYIAAAALLFSAGAQNVSHAWQFGAAHSEFRAIVLAVASGGATLLAPLAFAAVGAAFRKRRIGGAVVAFGLGCGALAYAAVNSLGFVAGSRDSAVSEHQAAADTYSDRRALAKAAREELASLKGQSPAVLERRAELTVILADLVSDKRPTARPAKPDSQAAALGFYIRAAGWHVDDASVGVWLSAGTVVFLESAAALSLIVAGALQPTRVGGPPAAGAPAPTPGCPAGRRGRSCLTPASPAGRQ